MSPDFRYHVASLAAVFMALGIGILIGTAFVGAPVVGRQTNLIRRLENRVSDLQRDTRERDQTEAALTSLEPRLVSTVLDRQPVLVIQTGTDTEAAEQAERALTAAGATVTRCTLPVVAWTRLDPGEVRARAESLAALVTIPSTPSLVQGLVDAGLLTGSRIDGPYPFVVFVGGGTEPSELDTVQRRDRVVVETLLPRSVRLAAVESTTTALSFLRVYQGAGIPTVAGIDRAAGRIALPFALRAAVPGAYGIGPSAREALPAAVAATPAPRP